MVLEDKKVGFVLYGLPMFALKHWAPWWFYWLSKSAMSCSKIALILPFSHNPYRTLHMVLGSVGGIPLGLLYLPNRE